MLQDEIRYLDAIVTDNKDRNDIADMIPGSGSIAMFQNEYVGVICDSMITITDTKVVKLPQAPISRLIFFKKLALLPVSAMIISLFVPSIYPPRNDYIRWRLLSNMRTMATVIAESTAILIDTVAVIKLAKSELAARY